MLNICLYWDFFSKPILGDNEEVKSKDEDKYLIRLNTFFNREKLSSTYKPVFLKSLIAISDYDENRLIGNHWIEENSEQLQVDLNFIAIRYIKYYWEFLFKFKLKQSHSPLDANINAILRKVGSEPKTPSPHLRCLQVRSFKV
jgi:hypothetical protein